MYIKSYLCNNTVMDLSTFCQFCETLPHTKLSTPFGPQTLVCKVGGKMYAAVDIEKFESVNVKNYPDKNNCLREEFNDIQPGYHMNKKYWNTVMFRGDVPLNIVQDLIKESYQIVYDSLSKKIKEQLSTDTGV